MRRLFTLLVLFLFSAGGLYCQSLTSSNLPIFVINTDWGVTIPDAPRVFGSMKIIYRGNGERNSLTDIDSNRYLNYNGRIAIELRGSSSQSLPKKQYGFSTYAPGDTAESNVSLLGLPADNDWVLNGLAWDPLLIRDYLCYNLYRRMDEYASRTIYCEVVLNNVYIGLYLLQEKVKQGGSRVNVIKITKKDYFEPNITGGYIIKCDRGDAVWTMRGYQPGVYTPFVNVLPKEEDALAEQNNYLKDQFENLAVTAMAGNTSTENGYPSIIDVRSFINYMILTEYSSNCDNYEISTYFHKDRNGKLRAGPIWDNDLTFGNDIFIWGLDRSHTNVWQFANGDNMGPTFWWDLFRSNKFNCSFYRRWASLTGPGGPLGLDSVSAFIDRTADFIEEAVQRNNARWSNNADFRSGLSDIKTWIAARIYWINSRPNSTGSCPDPILPPLVITKIMYHPDSTKAYPKPKDYEFIEIKNTSDKIVSLSGDYFLGTGFVYRFPAYSVVNPGGTKVLASNSTAFRQRFGVVPSDQFTRNLSNTGERLILADGFGEEIDKVEYSSQAPWPDADGNGAYLELIDPALDNNEPANWVAVTNSVVSVPSVQENDRLRLFPVPAVSAVTIESDQAIEKVEIYSMDGTLKKTDFPNTSEFRINIGSLSTGIYYAKIFSGSTVITRKIVKQ